MELLSISYFGHHLKLSAIVVVPEKTRPNKNDSAIVVYNNLSGKIMISTMPTVEMLLWFRLRSLNLVSRSIYCRQENFPNY